MTTKAVRPSSSTFIFSVIKNWIQERESLFAKNPLPTSRNQTGNDHQNKGHRQSCERRQIARLPLWCRFGNRRLNFANCTTKERLNFPVDTRYHVDIITHAIFLLENSTLIGGKY
jgi:hypothetical protein